jgi:hypothetical protein
VRRRSVCVVGIIVLMWGRMLNIRSFVAAVLRMWWARAKSASTPKHEINGW